MTKRCAFLCSLAVATLALATACLPPLPPDRTDMIYPTPAETLPAAGFLDRRDSRLRWSVPDPTPTPTHTPTTLATPDRLSGKANLRGVVCGEAGGGNPEGARLVAWTLRLRQLDRGDRYGDKIVFGPWNGWNGWCPDPDPAIWEWGEPDKHVWAAVEEVWNATSDDQAPFEFMRRGDRCINLGSNEDVLYWEHIGERDPAHPPDFVLRHPNSEYSSRFAINCYFTRGNWVEAHK